MPRGRRAGDSGFGSYGLQVNFGSHTSLRVTAPDTTMAEQADQGGGTLASRPTARPATARRRTTPRFRASPRSGSTTIRTWSTRTTGVVGPSDNGDDTTDSSSTDGSSTDVTPPPDGAPPTDGQVITVGSFTGFGDALLTTGCTGGGCNCPLCRAAAALAAASKPWTPLWRPPGPITVFRPAFPMDEGNQGAMTTLDFYSASENDNAITLSLTLPKNPKSEPMQFDAAEPARDGWNFSPPT